FVVCDCAHVELHSFPTRRSSDLDEKFSYVAATRLPAVPAASRVVRRPQIRKGQVLLDLCEAPPSLRRATVTKRHGDQYRAARDTDWGDPWPSPPPAQA